MSGSAIHLAVLIPAAGAARRMDGRDKLAEPVDGVPLLRRMSNLALGVSRDVVVTLPGAGHARAALLHDLAVRILPVPDAAAGMAASLRAGIAALRGASHAMILPADMPDLTADDLRRLADAAAETPGAILRATASDGRPGHPVIFPRAFFGEIAALSGDRGARRVIDAHADKLRSLALPGTHALCDLDTPADWAAWRAANPDR